MLDLFKPFRGSKPAPLPRPPAGTRFAVSLCNIRPGAAHLLRLDLAGEVRPIRLGDKDIKGVTGMVCDAGRLTVALQMKRHGGLAQLDARGLLERTTRIDALSDAHGLVRHGGELLAVATGGDKVLRIDSQHRVTGEICPFGDSGANHHHINDICVRDGDLVVSLFGPRRPNGLRIGAVARLSPFAELFDGLNDPHSVTADPEGLHVLDSATGTLYRIGPHGFTRITAVLGYARGLCLTAQHMLIGVSALRKASRTSTAQHPSRHAPDAPGAKALARCGVYVIDRASLTSRFIDLSAYASEIYQIAPWPEIA